jgi:hypothetical protein
MHLVILSRRIAFASIRRSSADADFVRFLRHWLSDGVFRVSRRQRLSSVCGESSRAGKAAQGTSDSRDRCCGPEVIRGRPAWKASESPGKTRIFRGIGPELRGACGPVLCLQWAFESYSAAVLTGARMQKRAIDSDKRTARQQCSVRQKSVPALTKCRAQRPVASSSTVEGSPGKRIRASVSAVQVFSLLDRKVAKPEALIAKRCRLAQRSVECPTLSSAPERSVFKTQGTLVVRFNRLRERVRCSRQYSVNDDTHTRAAVRTRQANVCPP